MWPSPALQALNEKLLLSLIWAIDSTEFTEEKKLQEANKHERKYPNKANLERNANKTIMIFLVRIFST